MRRFFDMDSPFMQGLIRFTDLMILNLLTLICCIPIVTIGAAVSALYSAVGRMQRDEGHLFSNYFEGFKVNFRKGTCLWLIMAPILGILIFALGYYTGGNLTPRLSSIGGIIVCIGIVIWCMVLAWVFPLQSRFENTVRGTLRNASICALAFLWRTIPVTVLNILPYAIFLAYPPAFMPLCLAWVLFYFSLAASLNLRLMAKPFAMMAPETVEEAEDEYDGEEDEEE